MMLFLEISTALLVLVVLVLSVFLLALARQIGILHERLAPIGPQDVKEGLRVGQAVPRLTGRLLDGSAYPILDPLGVRGRLLMVIGADCPVCKRALPLVVEAAKARDLSLVLLGEGEVPGLQALEARERLPAPLVLSQETLLLLQVARLPTLVRVAPDGTIVALGVASGRRDIAALLGPVDTHSQQEMLHDTP